MSDRNETYYERVAARDPAADGVFWYAVLTTGVYCKPSCPSRHARRENMRFFDSIAAAHATGARPCLRCDPDGAGAKGRVIQDVCRMIEAREDGHCTLAELGQAVGLSPSYLQRTFKRAMGVSPRAYAEQCRATRFNRALAGASSVTDAIYDAGYGSSSRFYEQATARIGMKASVARRGGQAERLVFAVGQCALGSILVASSAVGVAAIALGDDPDVLLRDLQDRFPRAELMGGDAAYDALVAQVIACVDAPRLGLDLPLDIRGTAFQRRVWEALRAIPAGETATYSDIAQRIGAPRAVRAVANACAANAHAVVIPCHRVVRLDGSASGYAWGLARKRALQGLEAVDAPS